MARAACQGEGGTQVAGGASSEVGRCSLRGVRAAWSPEGWGADVSLDVGAHTPLRPAPAPTAGQGHARARSKCPTGSPPPVDAGALLTPFDSPYVLPDGGVPQAFRSPAHLPDSISGAPKGGGPREKAGSADYGGAPPASLAATASRVTLSSYHAMLRASLRRALERGTWRAHACWACAGVGEREQLRSMGAVCPAMQPHHHRGVTSRFGQPSSSPPPSLAPRRP